MERDIIPEEPTEEPLPAHAVNTQSSKVFLSFLYIIVRRILTEPPLCGESSHLSLS